MNDETIISDKEKVQVKDVEFKEILDYEWKSAKTVEIIVKLKPESLSKAEAWLHSLSVPAIPKCSNERKLFHTKSISYVCMIGESGKAETARLEARDYPTQCGGIGIPVDDAFKLAGLARNFLKENEKE